MRKTIKQLENDKKLADLIRDENVKMTINKLKDELKTSRDLCDTIRRDEVSLHVRLTEGQKIIDTQGKTIRTLQNKIQYTQDVVEACAKLSLASLLKDV